MGSGGESNWKFRVVAFGCWLGLTLPLVWICRAGLDALPLPGLEGAAGTWLRWSFAVGLVVADSILVMAWMDRPRWYYLAGVACVLALAIGLESANIESGLRQESGQVASAIALQAEAERALLDQREMVRQAEDRVASAVATKPIWLSDGDKTNDGTLIESEGILAARKNGLAEAETKYREAIGQKANQQAEEHPLASAQARQWIVALGLTVIKALCWALCAVFHAVGPVAPSSLGGVLAPATVSPNTRRKRQAPSFTSGTSKGGFVAGMVAKLRQ